MTRLRAKLTAFNTLITGGIVLCMTVLCLRISEQSVRAEVFRNFESQFATATAYLQGQEQVRMLWLEQLEASGNMHIAVTDGDFPLFSVGFDPARSDRTAERARAIAQQEYGMPPEGNRGFSCSFSMTAENGTDYFAAVARIPKGDSALVLTLLRPLNDLRQRFLRQRLGVGLGAVVAVGLLGGFSWCFTGRVLRPVVESRQRQNRFIAAASHELRTPLTSILSAAAAMERAEGGDKKTFSQVIAREGSRMGRLIEDMLSLASADSDGWTMRKRPVEPDMLLLECYETFGPQARKKGLRLNLFLPEETPQILADPDRLSQALSILLDNALCYTPPSGNITLGLQTAGKKVRIFVADSGPGVPDGEKRRIFERFYQSETARSDRNHFGLGLNVAAEIANAHQGKLWVEDNPGGGAVFFLELP